MTRTNESHDHDGEMNLGDILRELYRWKWAISAAVLLAGVGAAIHSLTIPNTYESTAALIIREPQRAIDRTREGEAAPESAMLSVETLQTLTESTEITWALFEKLLEMGVLDTADTSGRDKRALFQDFQGTLGTELKRRQSRQSGNAIDVLPILVLKVRADNPERAAIVANAWAEMVEAKSGEIYAKGVEALSTYIGEMYTQSNESLLELESNLAAKELEAGLALKEARLRTLTDKITTLEDAILEIDIELAVNKVAIDEGMKRIVAQRVDSDWIGTIAEDALLKSEPYPFEMEELSAQAVRVVELTEQKVRQTDALRNFRREQNLLGKEKRFAHSQLDLDRILAEKAKVDDELPAVETAISALSEQLADIPETITLNKAITDNALWEVHVSGGGDDAAIQTPLKTETLNPLYQSTRETIVGLSSKAETLRGSTSQLERSEVLVMELTETLETEIDIITEELDRRTTALEATKIALAQLRDDFLEETKLVQELTLKNLRSEAERATRDDLRETLSDETRKLEESISQFTLQISALTRETEKTANVRTALATKAEEVALLQVSAENATRTGTTILYGAQANPNKVAPARSRIVLGTMAVALLACGALVCTARLLRESGEDV